MGEIIQFPPQGPQDDMVAFLEHLLDRARQGEIKGVMVVSLYEGGFHNARAGEIDLHRALGVLKVLEHDILMDAME